MLVNLYVRVNQICWKESELYTVFYEKNSFQTINTQTKSLKSQILELFLYHLFLEMGWKKRLEETSYYFQLNSP